MKIKDYGLIGDTRTAALISKNGSIDWCSFPRFDSSSSFAGVLDREKGGYFQLAPVDEYTSSQQYLPNTNILKTTFKTAQGVVDLMDFMPIGINDADNNVVAYSEIHRIIVSRRGEVKMKCIFEPRFNYGKGHTEIVKSKRHIEAIQSKKILILTGNIDFLEDEFTVKAKQRRNFVLYFGRVIVKPLEYFQSNKKLILTKNYWESWLNKIIYQGEYEQWVYRSILLLKMLSYSDSGAFIAAPTTSLPETIGGSRNWDYRFSWIRDSVFTLQAFYMLGLRSEARAFIQWIRKILMRDGIGVQIMYGIDTERNIPERQLEHLSGFADSRPVRIGNDAHFQAQHDIYGEIMDIMLTYVEYNGMIDKGLKHVLVSLVEYVCKTWEEVDSGIWEMREVNKQFTYSHLMCWVAIDRIIKIAKRLSWDIPITRWRKVSNDIKQVIMTQCWSEDRQAFTQARNDHQLDASSLLIPIYGFLPFDDPRVVSTVESIREVLCQKGLVYRYEEDEFEGEEGGFVFCSFWLIECLSRMGRKQEAKELLNEVLSYSNDLMMFPEEICPQSGDYLGNYPQAFSHIGLINCILSLQDGKDQFI